MLRINAGLATEVDALSARMRAGDVQALDTLNRSYGAAMLATGRRHCGTLDAARDAVQDAMLSAGQHLTDFRGTGSPRGWVLRMVANACRQMRRGRKNDPRWNLPFRDEPEADEGGEVLPATQPGPLEAPCFDDPEMGSARQELGRRLQRALDILSAQDRAIVLLALSDGHTAPEIAQAVGLPAATVRTRLSRARARLRRRLTDFQPEA